MYENSLCVCVCVCASLMCLSNTTLKNKYQQKKKKNIPAAVNTAFILPKYTMPVVTKKCARSLFT